MSCPTLPPEIIRHILVLSWQGEEQADTLRLLASCALVCRAWTHEARAELYRDIALHHHWSGAAKGSLHASSSKLLNTLKESGLGSHCRRLDVSCFRAKSVSHAEDVAEQAFRACTNITTLVLTFPSLYHGDPWIPDPAPRSIRTENLLRCVVQQLISLETSNISWGREMVDIVGASTSIKFLSVEDVLDGAASPSPALKLETYRGAGMLQSDTMSALLASSQPTLRGLFLTEESLPPGRVLNLSPYTALRSVYLSCDLDSDETQLRNVIKSLKSAAFLQEFTLSHSLAAEMQYPGDLNSLDLLRLVPSSVRRLRLIYLSLGTQYLLDALSDSTCLVALQSIALDRRAWEAGMDDAWPLERPQSESEEVSDVARKRGVQVVWNEEEEEEEEEEDGEGGSASAEEEDAEAD